MADSKQQPIQRRTLPFPMPKPRMNADQAILVAQAAPSVAQAALSVAQAAPSVTQAAPSVAQAAPSVAQAAPSVAQAAASGIQVYKKKNKFAYIRINAANQHVADLHLLSDSLGVVDNSITVMNEELSTKNPEFTEAEIANMSEVEKKIYLMTKSLNNKITVVADSANALHVAADASFNASSSGAVVLSHHSGGLDWLFNKTSLPGNSHSKGQSKSTPRRISKFSSS
jgi:hypothetical protein